MKLDFQLCLFIIGFIFAQFFLTETAFAQNDQIRVRLESKISSFDFEATGASFYGKEKIAIPVAIPKNNKITIRREKVGTGVVWVVKTHSSHQEEIFTENFLAIKAYGPRKGAKLYPEQLLFSSKDKSLSFDVIGVLPVENYLVGVLASEMPLAWPVEALKAQAIAARSYAQAVMLERKDKEYHVESSILDQVFTHISQEIDQSPLIEKAKAAVLETKGIVLTSPRGNVLKAFYHSDCGGKTTQATNVWGFGVNSGVATDSYCPSNPSAHWHVKISEAKMVEKLSLATKSKFTKIFDLRLVKMANEDRIAKLEFKDEFGKSHSVPGNQLREAVGYTEIKSTWFQMSKSADGFEIEGQGFGHGVGLCQWGSKSMAKAGKSYLEIIKHYYPQANLKPKSSPEELIPTTTASTTY